VDDALLEELDNVILSPLTLPKETIYGLLEDVVNLNE
jgi:hypothetical protein